MEIDEDLKESVRRGPPFNLKTSVFNRDIHPSTMYPAGNHPLHPHQYRTLPHNPSRIMLGARRSSSGLFFSNVFGPRFRHLQKLHTEAFALGLNAVSYPGLPIGTMFRSSLPATPVSTPIHREPFHQFTEQALRERLCKTPSPRKNRNFMPSDEPMDAADSEPMDTTESGLEDICESPQLNRKQYASGINYEAGDTT